MLVLNPNHRTHNGMNFVKSVKNPNSRIARLVRYLRDEGPARKEEILLDVFQRVVRPDGIDFNTAKSVLGTDTVTRGWGWYMWNLGLHYDIIRKTRVKNHVVYSLGDNWKDVTV